MTYHVMHDISMYKLNRYRSCLSWIEVKWLFTKTAQHNIGFSQMQILRLCVCIGYAVSLNNNEM